MSQEDDPIRGGSRVALRVISDTGGVDQLLRDLNSPSPESARRARERLEVLILTVAPECAPLPAEVDLEGRADPDARFTERVRRKVERRLRWLADQDWPASKKEGCVVGAVRDYCAKTAHEPGYGLRSAKTSAREKPKGVFLQGGPQGQHRTAREGVMQQSLLALSDRGPSKVARLAVLLALFLEGRPDALESLLQGGRGSRAKEIASILGCSQADAAELMSAWKREFSNEERRARKAMLPHLLKEVERRLSKLASEGLDRLPDVKLRLMMFEISRALAASFAPEDVYGREVRGLADLKFEDAIDLLLDERGCLGVEEQRTTLERLMQGVVRVRDALRDGDLSRAFAYGALLVLDAARVQHHKSSTRVQVLLSYTYLLRVAGWCDAYIRANGALAHSCDALARREGERSWDQPAEFESGETLRRVRTYATMNELIGLFYFKLTTARQERYRVRDYRGLTSLPDRFEALLRLDPQADFINEELLVVRAHLVRVCENRCKRGVEQEWGPRMEQASKELRALIYGRFVDTKTGEIDAKRLIKAAHAAGEGHAAARTLDVIETVFRDQRHLVKVVRAEREAVGVLRLAGGEQQ